MKVALVLPANLYFCPYLTIYTHILDTYNIEYDLIYWDKEQRDEGGIRFVHKMEPHDNIYNKFSGYYLYSRFVVDIIKRNLYSKLVVFTPQIALFLYPFLNRYYKKNFVFDYRDLSIEQRFKWWFKKILNISAMSCISSPGFKECLPRGYDYILSHNINIDILKIALTNNHSLPLKGNSKIVVSTIGGIRDYDANKELIAALKNNRNFLIRFIGKGPASRALEAYANDENIENIDFEGFYNKDKESGFVTESTFLNIYYPQVITHATALSNRFYNALVYKRPMIVTSNSIQADYVEKYNLGLIIDNCDGLASKLQNYCDRFDADLFNSNCNELLLQIQSDYSLFEKRFLSYLYN